MNWKEVQRTPEDDDEENKMLYDQAADRLLDLVEIAAKAGLPPVYMMSLLLDKSLDLALHILGSKEKVRDAVEIMLTESNEMN